MTFGGRPAREDAPWELKFVPRIGCENPVAVSFAAEITQVAAVRNTL